MNAVVKDDDSARIYLSRLTVKENNIPHVEGGEHRAAAHPERANIGMGYRQHRSHGTSLPSALMESSADVARGVTRASKEIGGRSTVLDSESMRIATRVADIDMQLVCDDPPVYTRLCHRFQGFPGPATRSSDARGAGHCATVRIEGELPAAPPEFDIAVHDNEFALGYRIGGPSALILRDTESSDDALDLHLHSALLHLFSLALIDDEKLLLHAGAGSYANSTSLFVGRSGAGKSTLAAMFPSECVLNDEFVAVSADGRQVYATPFYGTSMSERSGKPRSETIDRFLTLRHATRPALRRVSGSDAAVPFSPQRSSRAPRRAIVNACSSRVSV